MPPPKCALRCAGLQARNLRSTDFNNLCDPYILLRVGKETWQSRAINSTLNPVWSEPSDYIVFGANPKAEFEKQDLLWIDVMDRDVFSSTLVGSCSVFFGDLFASSIEQGVDPLSVRKQKTAWYALMYQGMYAGEIGITMEAIGFRPAPGKASTTMLVDSAGNALAAAGGLPLDGAGAGAAAGGAGAGGAGAGGAAGPTAGPAFLVVPNCLRVTVRAARGLIPFGSTCSSFAKLTVAEFTVSTRVKPTDVNPVWNEGWAFPVVERNSAILLDVFHSRSLGSPPFQGKLAVSLNDIDGGARGAPVRQWFPLMNKEGKRDKMRGDVELEVQWGYNAAFAAAAAKGAELFAAGKAFKREAVKILADGTLERESPLVADPADMDGTSGEVVDPKAAEAKAAEEEEKKKAREARLQALSSVEIKDGDWQVQVHVIEARQLKAENASGTSDPVCYVEVGKEKQHTAIHKDTTSCVFDHHMFFNLPRMTKAEVEAITVKISVFDANLVARDELIGRFTFDALEVYYQPNHQYYRR